MTIIDNGRKFIKLFWSLLIITKFIDNDPKKFTTIIDNESKTLKPLLIMYKHAKIIVIIMTNYSQSH